MFITACGLPCCCVVVGVVEIHKASKKNSSLLVAGRRKKSTDIYICFVSRGVCDATFGGSFLLLLFACGYCYCYVFRGDCGDSYYS